jgi:hypothetical protein
MNKLYRKKRIRLLKELEDLEDKRKLFHGELYEELEINHLEDAHLHMVESQRNIEDIVTCLHEGML